MARSDKTHEQRIVDLEVELANLNIFLDHWMSRPVLKPEPRTFWQKLNDYFSR